MSFRAKSRNLNSTNRKRPFDCAQGDKHYVIDARARHICLFAMPSLRSLRL
ncbi:MAG: hypothetical protein HFE34_04145 [Clostridia bacterium]|nr:hypothetical protein [Clostridia bacterium]